MLMSLFFFTRHPTPPGVVSRVGMQTSVPSRRNTSSWLWILTRTVGRTGQYPRLPRHAPTTYRFLKKQTHNVTWMFCLHSAVFERSLPYFASRVGQLPPPPQQQNTTGFLIVTTITSLLANLRTTTTTYSSPTHFIFIDLQGIVMVLGIYTRFDLKISQTRDVFHVLGWKLNGFYVLVLKHHVW